jgi:hypothetical protein
VPSKRNLVVALVLAAGLALTAPAPLVAQDAQKQAAPKKERDRIVRDELQQPNMKEKDLYTAIRALRPHFLQPPRGSSSMRSVGAEADQRTVGLRVELPKAQVMIDGNKAGDLEILKTLQADQVEEVRYMSPNQAGNEFGLGYEGGLIQVKLIKVEKPPF